MMGPASRIKGKLILVTGELGDRGGVRTAFAAEGADLILWARRADRLERLAAELGTKHRVSLSLAVIDVRDRAAVERTAEALVRAGRVPDVLITTRGSPAAWPRFTKAIRRLGSHDRQPT